MNQPGALKSLSRESQGEYLSWDVSATSSQKRVEKIAFTTTCGEPSVSEQGARPGCSGNCLVFFRLLHPLLI